MPYKTISHYRFVTAKQCGVFAEWAVIGFGRGQSVPVGMKGCSVGTSLALAQVWCGRPAVALPSKSAAGSPHGNTREHMGLGLMLL